MDSSARIEAAFEHKRTERTPIFEYCLLSDDITHIALGRKSAALHWNEYLKEHGWENAVRQIAADAIETAVFFGFDMIYQPANRMPQAMADALREKPEATDIMADPVEILIKRNERRRQNPLVYQENLLIYKMLREELDKRHLDIPILGQAYHHGVWTDINLMQTMILDEEVAKEHFSIATETALMKINEFKNIGIKYIGIGGDCAGNTPLISPESYRKFIMTELQNLSSVIHSFGGYAINTSDGNLWPFIDDFLIGSGVDAYMEIDFHAGMDLAKLKKLYGKSKTLFGNMDCGNILSSSNPDSVKKATIECLEAGEGWNGGHIFSASNAITDSIPILNYFTMHNTYRDYFNLPHIRY